MHPEPRARRADPTDRDITTARTGDAPRPLPLFVVATLVLLIGFGLGWMGRYTDAGGFRGAQEFARLGGPWLVGAYVAGALCAWRRGPRALWIGMAGGAVAIALGSLTYYGIYVWLEYGHGYGYGVRRAVKLGVGWAAAGVVVGGAVGGLGALLSARWRTGTRDWVQGASVGTLGGLLIGEAIALLWVWESLSLRTMATLEGLGGAALVLIASIGRPWRWVLAAFAAAAFTATIAPIATTMVRETLRSIGWAGA